MCLGLRGVAGLVRALAACLDTSLKAMHAERCAHHPLAPVRTRPAVALKPLIPKLSGLAVRRSLLMYLGVRKPERALAVFDWLDAQPEEQTLTIDAYHYVALMSAFARRGTASDAAQVRAARGPGTKVLCWLCLPICLHYMPYAACSATHCTIQNIEDYVNRGTKLKG